MQEALNELFSNYYQDVYNYLYSLSRDAPLSEDLASEVFLEAVRSIAGFRREASVKTWLFAIARHKWFAHLRRKKRQAEAEALLEFYESPGADPGERYQDRALAERIYALLEAEPERTRHIVLMRIEGYSFYEIGTRFGISENSARVIDFRAKAKIRKILKEEGFFSE